MNVIKQFKRNCLIRLMSALGFGGMTAFCLASCQPAVNDVQQPRQEKSNKTAPEAAQPNAPEAVEKPEAAKEKLSGKYVTAGLAALVLLLLVMLVLLLLLVYLHYSFENILNL